MLLYFLCYYHPVIIKQVNKGTVVMIWDRGDYLREAHSQCSEKVCISGSKS